MNANFLGYYFHRNANIWGYFHICISAPLLRYQISATENSPIRKWNWWQDFVSGTVANLFQKTYYSKHSLPALWTNYVFKMRILSLRIFIQTTLFLAEFDVLFPLSLVILLLNRINVDLFSHRRNRYSINYQTYIIRNTPLRIKNYVLHKLAIFNFVLLLYCIYC